MLTIHKPIVRKTAGSILRIKEGFAQRIQANYEMMTAKLTAVDLLHLITADPNVYLYGSEMASFTNQAYSVNHQTIKLRLINNVLNRIFVSDTVAMTYQDRVFVTHIMNKIGIKDIREFIRAFWMMQNDLRNVRQLTAMYPSKHGMIQAVLEYQKKLQTDTRERTNKTEMSRNREYWLHQIIFERLHTGEIYRELCSFVMGASGNTARIQVNEIQISEQSASAYRILLNQRIREAHMEPQILSYNHLRSFASGGTVPVNERYGEQIIRDLAGVVLFNVLTQAYEVSLERQERIDNKWYELISLIHQSAQNTLVRMERCDNRFAAGKSVREEHYETLQDYQQVQMHMLQWIFAQQGGVYYADYIQNVGTLESKYNTVLQYEYLGQVQNTEAVTVLTEKNSQDSISSLKTDYETDSYEKQIRQQLAVIHQNNLERINRIRQISLQSFGGWFQKTDKEKARQEILRIMEKPDAAVYEDLRSNPHSQMELILQNGELRQVLGEETVRAFEEIRRRQEYGAALPDKDGESIKAFDMLVHDVSTVRMSKSLERADTKQYRKDLEHTKSAMHTDLETKYRREYDTSVINQTMTQTAHKDIRQYDETIRRKMRHIALLHRQTQTGINKEALETFIRNSRQVSSDSPQQTEQYYRTNRVTEVVNNTFNAIGQQQDKGIEQVVLQELNRRLGDLCEQVYTKLERRMDSERRRRGL